MLISFFLLIGGILLCAIGALIDDVAGDKYREAKKQPLLGDKAMLLLWAVFYYFLTAIIFIFGIVALMAGGLAVFIIAIEFIRNGAGIWV